MLNLFQTLNEIYTSRSYDWIDSVDESLSPVVINLMLSRDFSIHNVTTFLNKYVYFLDLKSFVKLAWSVTPKRSKAPFVKKIKEDVKEEDYKIILDKIKDKLKISNNDWSMVKKYYIIDVSNNLQSYAEMFGLDKRTKKKLGL